MPGCFLVDKIIGVRDELRVRHLLRAGEKMDQLGSRLRLFGDKIQLGPIAGCKDVRLVALGGERSQRTRQRFIAKRKALTQLNGGCVVAEPEYGQSWHQATASALVI